MERGHFEGEHEIFRESFRRFLLREVAPHSERWREQGQVDRTAFERAGREGYLLMWADARFGGAGITDFRYEQVLIEENQRHGDPGFYMTLHSRIVAPYVNALAAEPLKERVLPGCVRGETILGIAMTEPGAGSDLSGIRMRAQDHGDHWRLSGSKTYISNGQIGDLFVVAARTDPERRHGIGLFLVDALSDGFRRGRNLKKMGLKSQDTSELFFDEVRVPKGSVLGDPSRGFSYLAQFLVEERLIGACMYVSHAQVAFDLTLDFIRERRVFGRPLGALQNTRFKMAEMRAQLDALQIFVDHCVREHNAHRLSAEVAAEAKLLASELEGRVMDECVQLHGGAGYMDEYRISRMYTDARVSRIYAGSSEIMKEIIARSIGLDERKMT
jgi:alkylation response protein AidB-like acyl-CoA dehydrogenase